MSAWSDVRRLAQQRHGDLASSPDELIPAAALLEAAERTTGVKRASRPAGDTLLDGAEATYDPQRKRIYYSRAIEQALANFYVAHEYGHHWLGEAAASCERRDIDVSSPAEPMMSLVGDADAYSPKERAEAQANVFAREFLLPRAAKLRRRCSADQFDAAAIATELGVPVDLVMQQLADALLLPEERAAAAVGPQEPTPDESQREAITAPHGPRQVRAGPGAGKTRTLVGRIAHLVSIGEDPTSILALTYSNLSAQDLAERIRAAIGNKATAVWAGTFHAYGLELLRKYGSRVSLPETLKLLDRTDSLMLLEDLLPELKLSYYLNLRDPALTLRSILGAIGRAKDELVSAAEYERLARVMRERASDDKAQEAAERALEVAHAYAVYDQTLRTRGLVDFGDLVARPVELLRAHSDVRDAIRAEKRHILVDEYQDMNRASGKFLRELVAPGRGPWVVGDVRQAIYRFRGASPLNMSRFADDFPGAQTTNLSVNYRSGGKIVRAFEAFGACMTASRLSSQGKLKAHRGEHAGVVLYEIASARESEAHGIAKSILARVAAGAHYGEHAVLARSHTILARLSSHLERAGVPCLYFGDFFERPEVRDLLALLSFVAEPRGVGLFHVAQMPRYAVSPADIAVVFAWRRQHNTSMLAAVRKLDEIDGLSPSGRAGLEQLRADVSFVDWPMPPHRCLMCYLFRRCDHMRQLLADATVAGQQRRLAVYQLLQFAFTFKPPPAGDPKRAFLDHIRRLEILDEEKQLRQLPAAARDIDAVRLMTVHASKGLEFPAVYVTSLAKGLFPARSRYEACPPPAGMISSDDLMSPEVEEDSLFFVAMSRARDTLHLSRALTNGKASTKNPLRFLEVIAPHLSKALDGHAGWVSQGPPDPPYPALAGAPAEAEWTARALETYLDCPRKYYYAYVLEILGNEDSSPYLRFQSALHASIAWMRTKASGAERRAGIKERFEADWSNFGPAGHAFERFYQSIALKMIDNAISMMDGESLEVERTVTLPATGAVVRCRIDHVQLTPTGVSVLRLKASRLSKTETDKPRYALWQQAAASDHAGSRVMFEHVSLLTGERRQSTFEQKKLRTELKVLDDAVQNVNAGRFDPNPGPYCPACPYYVVCPTPGTIC